MPARQEGSLPGPTTYIRGEAVASVDGRRVIRALGVAGLVVLVGIVVATALGAAHQNSVQHRLQRDGVRVVATVTGCPAVTSGIGQAVEYYDCTATYVLDGHRYHAVLGGSRVARPAGQEVQAVTVPGHPALLSIATAVARRTSPLAPYVTPIAWGAVAAAWVLLFALWARRHPSARRSPGSPVPEVAA